MIFQCKQMSLLVLLEPDMFVEVNYVILVQRLWIPTGRVLDMVLANLHLFTGWQFENRHDKVESIHCKKSGVFKSKRKR